MMRKATILIALLLLPLSLFSISVNGNEIENPFPSRENLEAFGFERQSDIFRGIEVNLITTETGKEIYSYFGHTSLEVLIPGYRPVFYDYGYFSFSEGFYRNFLFGRLFYNVYASDGEMRLRGFEAEDRSVHRTPIDLSEEALSAIFSYLQYNTRSENNTYLYDYYLDNCATRVRDIYDEATGGSFKAWAENIKSGSTLRRAANAHLDKNPAVSFTLNYLEGPSIDRPSTLYDECFLPLTLMRAIEEYEEVESQTIRESKSLTEYRSLSLNTWTLIFSIAFYFISMLLYASKRRWLCRLSDILNAILYLYLALLSAVLLFMMSATNHSVTYFNANLLYANPLIIIMAAEALRGKKERKRYVFSLVSITILAIGFSMKAIFPEIFIQENLPVLTLMGSVYLINISRHFLNEK